MDSSRRIVLGLLVVAVLATGVYGGCIPGTFMECWDLCDAEVEEPVVRGIIFTGDVADLSCVQSHHQWIELTKPTRCLHEDLLPCTITLRGAAFCKDEEEGRTSKNATVVVIPTEKGVTVTITLTEDSIGFSASAVPGSESSEEDEVFETGKRHHHQAVLSWWWWTILGGSIGLSMVAVGYAIWLRRSWQSHSRMAA